MEWKILLFYFIVLSWKQNKCRLGCIHCVWMDAKLFIHHHHHRRRHWCLDLEIEKCSWDEKSEHRNKIQPRNGSWLTFFLLLLYYFELFSCAVLFSWINKTEITLYIIFLLQSVWQTHKWRSIVQHFHYAHSFFAVDDEHDMDGTSVSRREGSNKLIILIDLSQLTWILKCFV